MHAFSGTHFLPVCIFIVVLYLILRRKGRYLEVHRLESPCVQWDCVNYPHLHIKSMSSMSVSEQGSGSINMHVLGLLIVNHWIPVAHNVISLNHNGCTGTLLFMKKKFNAGKGITICTKGPYCQMTVGEQCSLFAHTFFRKHRLMLSIPQKRGS